TGVSGHVRADALGTAGLQDLLSASGAACGSEYVRQSTLVQVREHPESTRLQYGLVDRAVALGWTAARVVVIDDDLGRSGAGGGDRPGFQRLVTEISLGHVGIVVGIDMSRLARSGRDWYQLIELCALTGRCWRTPTGCMTLGST